MTSSSGVDCTITLYLLLLSSTTNVIIYYLPACCPYFCYCCVLPFILVPFTHQIVQTSAAQEWCLFLLTIKT